MATPLSTMDEVQIAGLNRVVGTVILYVTHYEVMGTGLVAKSVMMQTTQVVMDALTLVL